MHAASERRPEYIECMVRLQLRIHQQSAADFPSIKLRLAARIATETNLTSGCRQDLLAKLSSLADGDRLCHGDFHPVNILGDTAHPVVIDWPDAGRCNPGRGLLSLLSHSEDPRRGFGRALSRPLLPAGHDWARHCPGCPMSPPRALPRTSPANATACWR